MLISGGLSLLSGGIGAISQSKQQKQQNAAAKKLTQYENATDLQNWEYSKQLRDYEYNQQLQIYDKSKEVYSKQLGYNDTAAGRSFEAESRKMNEYLQGMAFQKQDLFLNMMQAQGKAGAMETAGRSTARLQRDSLSQFGRDNAVMAENLVSAARQHQYDIGDIELQRQNANFDAYTRLGLAPIKGPTPPKPISRPSATGSTNPLLTIGSVVANAVSSGYSAYSSSPTSPTGSAGAFDYSSAFKR
jgi:hypothetical protein